MTLGGAQRVLTRFPGLVTIDDVSADGRVLLTTAQWYRGLMVVGPGDAKERDLAWFENAHLGALSHDGQTLLFGDRGRGTGPPAPVQTYLRRTDGSPAVHLGEGLPVALSPDGRWVLSAPNHPSLRCQLLPTGPGEPRPLPLGGSEWGVAAWLPDGRRVVVNGHEKGHPPRIFIEEMDGNARRAVTPGGFLLYLGSEVSPDGKLFLAIDAQRKVTAFPVDGGEPRPVPVVRPQEAWAGWGADSQSLYVYARESDLPVKIDRIDLRTGPRELFKAITPPDPAAFGGVYNIRVAPDGKTYAYDFGRYLCILYVIEGLR